MSRIKLFQRSFSGGEISPELFGRIDDAKYQSGLAKCRNFITKPQGPAENRPGFAFVREVKHSALKTRLIPFTYSTTQTMIIEIGAGYFRFHTMGATLMNGAVPYEITNPYLEDDLFDIHHVQSADVMTLVHPNHPPKELKRYGALDWRLEDINFSPPIDAPGKPSLIKVDGGEPKYYYEYVVTAISVDGFSESKASESNTIFGNLFFLGGKNIISWDLVEGASRYNIYKLQGGLFGFIGQTDKLTITDDNIAPDLSKTPPRYDLVFQNRGIHAVPVINKGSDYEKIISGGEITSVEVLNMGKKYAIPTTATITDPTGSGAILDVDVVPTGEMFGGAITGIHIINGGLGYTNPSITARSWNGNGSGAVLKVKASAVVRGKVKLAVTDPTGNGASLRAEVINGKIERIIVDNPGSGYTAPVVSISDPGGGSGAVLGTPELTGVGWPGAVSYFEQRRCFAGTKSQPQNIWMTKSGTESNMSYSLPIRDDDRIAFRVAAREANTIRHIVPLAQLLLLTSSAEWRVTSVNSDAITPTTISVRPQSYVGASNVQPVIINNTLIYGSSRGGHIRELGYNWQANGFITSDLSLRAPHLFDNKEITDMTYVKAPQPIVWFVSSNGKLLGLTYVPEEQIGAWHWHDTDGTFESCAAVTEGHEDVLYCVIKRTINKKEVRYVERMASRQFDDQKDAFFVDCGLTYQGAPAMRVVGLGHLEGKKVSILADGAVCSRQVVTNGSVELDEAAATIHIGLPIEADLKTLPMAIPLQDGSYGQGMFKNVNKAWLRVYRSSGIFIGPSEETLTEAKQRTTESCGTAPVLKSEEIPLTLTPSWADSGQIIIRQYDPLPLTVVSLTAEVALGG